MPIRVICDPLFVSPDLRLVGKGDIDTSLFLLDPLKYNQDGVKEAGEYSNQKWLSAYLGDTDIGQCLTRDYTKSVYGIIHEEDQTKKTDTYLALMLIAARSRSEILFGLIDRDRKKVNEPKNPPAHHAPERYWNEFFSRQRNSGYAEDDAYVEKSVRLKHQLNEYLEKLGYLAAALEPEHTTIGLMSAFFPLNGQLVADANVIFINRKILAKPALATKVLKEEILHYLDYKLKISDNPDFHRAVDALLAKNNPQGDEFERIHAQAHAQDGERTKMSLHTYIQKTPGSQYSEMLVDYFHIRDYLFALNAKKGCGFAAKIMEHRNPQQVAKDVDTDLEKLFGKTIHEACKKFDETLQQRASEVGHGAAIGLR